MITFEIHDMTCGHCASTITKALQTVDKAAQVQIDVHAHRVKIEPTAASADELRDVILEAGYTPVLVLEGGVKPVAAKRSGCCCA